MNMKTRLLLASASLVACASAQAALFTWDITPGTVGAGNGSVQDGSGAWDSTTGNWTTDGGVTNVAYGNALTDTVRFGSGGAGGTVSVVGTLNTGGLTFGTTTGSGYTLTGGTLTLANPTTIAVNNTAFETSIASVLDGSSALTVTGTGTLSLSGINTYTGGTIIDGATVNMNDARATGSNGTTRRAMTIKSGKLNLGFTSSAGAYGSGAPIWSVLLSDLTMGGTAGATSELSSTGIISGNPIGFGIGPGTGGSITYDATNNGGTATISAIWSATGTSAAGTATVNVGDSSATNLEMDFTARISYDQNDGRNVTLDKTGAGVMRISAANFLPGLKVSAGRLIANHVQALGADSTANGGLPNTILVSSGGTLQIGGASGPGTIEHAVTAGGTMTVEGGVLDLLTDAASVLTFVDGANLVMTSGTILVHAQGNTGATTLGQIRGGTGAFQLTGGTLNLGGFFNAAGQYQLFSGFSGANSTTGLTLTGFDAANFAASVSNTGVLTVSVIPEPSAYGLAGAGALLAVSLVRRRRRKV